MTAPQTPTDTDGEPDVREILRVIAAGHGCPSALAQDTLERLAQPTPSQDSGSGELLREALAAAIQQADDAFGYNLTLTRLVDGEATYTLTMPGFVTMEVSEMDEGYAIITERRNKCRADAILAALKATPDTGGEHIAGAGE